MYFNIRVTKIEIGPKSLVLDYFHLSIRPKTSKFICLIKDTQVCDTKLKNNSKIDTSYLIDYLIPLFTTLLK